MNVWQSDEAPREFMLPRALWYLRCWCTPGSRALPAVGWLGMHAKAREAAHALERSA